MRADLDRLRRACDANPDDIEAWMWLAREANRHGFAEEAGNAWGHIHRLRELEDLNKPFFERYLSAVRYVHGYKRKLIAWLRLHYNIHPDHGFLIVKGREPLPKAVQRLPFSDELDAFEAE